MYQQSQSQVKGSGFVKYMSEFTIKNYEYVQFTVYLDEEKVIPDGVTMTYIRNNKKSNPVN